ncbi:MAG: ABC transporter ATP-binding protein [Chloroflexi bacterium]|nr:ABC transporter ATP-binding protein [Chloroflexota bacterium]HCU80830.1 ABC transporter ATP-binding protein [Chloroflexota bacterium]
MNPAIEVKGLTKRYPQASSNAVDSISFDVPYGEFFALLGPNGAGKTTTISILTTTLAATSGTVRVCGFDVQTDPSGVRRNSGIIFQNRSLDENLTAEENIRLHAILYGMYGFRPTFGTMPGVYKEKVNELASVLGIETQIHSPIKSLSGGMKRKLEIIRGLIHSPKVLFLDEPTTGLDPESRRNLWEYLSDAQERNGVTVFLTTHYLEEVNEADKICIINQGRIVSLGSPDEVKADLAGAYLVVDCNDRASLIGELDALGVKYEVNRRIRIEISQSQVHDILRKIETPLSLVETQDATLEDAYLKIIGEDSWS